MRTLGCCDAGIERSRTHLTHTPARRLFRALLAMSQEQAQQFAVVAMRVLRRIAVTEWKEDVTQAFFWWSNIQQLRLFLKQLVDGDVQVPGDWGWLQPDMEPLLTVCSHPIFCLPPGCFHFFVMARAGRIVPIKRQQSEQRDSRCDIQSRCPNRCCLLCGC
jgi:hypothetical protein